MKYVNFIYCFSYQFFLAPSPFFQVFLFPDNIRLSNCYVCSYSSPKPVFIFNQHHTFRKSLQSYFQSTIFLLWFLLIPLHKGQSSHEPKSFKYQIFVLDPLSLILELNFCKDLKPKKEASHLRFLFFRKVLRLYYLQRANIHKPWHIE